MRYSQVLSLSAILIAGLALGSVNTASAAPGGRNDNRRDSGSQRYDNGRNDRHDNNSRRDFGRGNDRHDDRGRYDRNDHRDNHNSKSTVIIKKDSNRWDVGDALLYHLGRTVINDVFDVRPKTTVIVTQPTIVTGHYELIWVEPVYVYRRTACGDLVKVVEREGFYKKVWIPATTSCETGYH
jgi:hypothetical protein